MESGGRAGEATGGSASASVASTTSAGVDWADNTIEGGSVAMLGGEEAEVSMSARRSAEGVAGRGVVSRAGGKVLASNPQVEQRKACELERISWLVELR